MPTDTRLPPLHVRVTAIADAYRDRVNSAREAHDEAIAATLYDAARVCKAVKEITQRTINHPLEKLPNG